MENTAILAKMLSDTFHASIKTFDTIKLAGDASSRSYSRLCWRQNGVHRSAIFMEMSDSEGAQTSDEAQSETTKAIRELPFINIQKHLLACKVPVPVIYHIDPARGWILLEDLGERTLAEVLGTPPYPPSPTLDYYRAALDALVTLQLEASPQQNGPSIAHLRRFDQRLFEWEFDHFLDYGIEARIGIAIDTKKKRAVRSIFSEIASELAALPQVFTHRDYHSRNLMVNRHPAGFNIGILDFQDALMGPPQYDLASLLRDAYIDLPEALIDDLLNYYFDRYEARSGASIARAAFREAFDYTSIQRNLKAAGRFIYIDKVKGKNHLLPFVSPSLQKAKRNLQKYDRLKPLLKRLAPYVPEFQS